MNNDFNIFGLTEDNEFEEPNLLYDNEEYLEERFVIKCQNKIKIGVFPSDTRFKYDMYFKIIKGDNWKSTSIEDRTRISFKTLKYINHPNDPGNWILNGKERKMLMNYLLSSKESNIRGWDLLLNEVYICSNYSIDIRNIPLLDYNKLPNNFDIDNGIILYK